MEKYTEILKSLDPGKKIAFLEKILQNSPELQSQLINYFTNNQKDKPYKPINFNEIVIQEAAACKDALEAIDLEETDYDRWDNRRDRYYKEWEIAQEVAEEEINDMFDSFSDEYIELLSKGELNTMMAKLTGLLIACYETDIDDPNDNLGDEQQELLTGCFSRIADSIEIVISKTILNADAVVSTFKEIAQCFQHGEANTFDAKIHDKLIQSLLKNNPESCSEIYNEFITNQVAINLFPLSYMQATRYGNPASWEQEAVKMSPDHIAIAKDLLEFEATNNSLEFYRNAKKLFPIFSRELVDIISETIDDTFDIRFAKDVLSFKVLKDSNIDDYSRLAKLFSITEKESFLDKLKKSYNCEFYIQVLESEGMFQQILRFASAADTLLSEYLYILKPILPIYPSECLAIAEKKVRTNLEQHMSRDSYKYAAQLLKLVLSDEHNTATANKLISDLCLLYSRRTAMKDEFRKEGILK